MDPAQGVSPNLLLPLGLFYIGLGFVGSFLSQTVWWRRRFRWGRLSILLRTLLFLVLVRGFMYVTPTRGWAAIASLLALAAGSLLLWLDARHYSRQA